MFKKETHAHTHTNADTALSFHCLKEVKRQRNAWDYI